MGYIIDSSRCVGCGACAYECLFGIPKPVDEEKSRYHIDREECVGCGQCSRVCPVNAIVKDPKQPVIRKVTIKKNKTTSKQIKGLKKGKKYYVRIRSFKTVNGKKFYSAWSAKKTVTIKE